MKKIPVLIVFLATIAPFNFTFAQDSLQQIAFIENIPEYLSTEGNIATLYKMPRGCKLDFVIYGELGKWQEVYQYKNNQLISAYSVQTDYQNGGLVKADNTAIKPKKQIIKSLNIKQRKTINSFNELKNKFSKKKLTLCQL